MWCSVFASVAFVCVVRASTDCLSLSAGRSCVRLLGKYLWSTCVRISLYAWCVYVGHAVCVCAIVCFGVLVGLHVFLFLAYAILCDSVLLR